MVDQTDAGLINPMISQPNDSSPFVYTNPTTYKPSLVGMRGKTVNLEVELFFVDVREQMIAQPFIQLKTSLCILTLSDHPAGFLRSHERELM